MATIKKFLNENFIIVTCSAALAFVLGGFIWAFFVLRAAADSAPGISTPLILHFNDLNGVTSVGGLGTIVFVAMFGVLIVLMNFAIAREFERRGRDRFFGRFIAVLTLLFGILLFIAFVAIINVNV